MIATTNMWWRLRLRLRCRSGQLQRRAGRRQRFGARIDLDTKVDRMMSRETRKRAKERTMVIELCGLALMWNRC